MAVEAVESPSPIWSERWRARSWLWRESHIPAVRRCGRTPRSVGEPIELFRYPSGQVSMGGLQHCRSVWACPVCSARAISRRAEQLQTVVDGWHSEGHRVGFVTLTVRHTAKMPGSEVWDLLMGAWGKTIAGKVWTGFQRRWGIEMPGRRKHRPDCPVKTRQEPLLALGPTEWNTKAVHAAPDSVSDCECPRPSAARVPTVRTVEALYGRHGWHLHLHVLVFFDGRGTEAEVRDRWGAMSSWLVARWGEQVSSLGGTVDIQRGTDVELIDPTKPATERIARYLQKAVYEGSASHSAIHWEMAGGRAKVGRSANRTPWQILEAAADGDERSRARWHEWELMSRGRRQMWITGALLDRYGVRDLSDAEAVALADDRAENWAPADNFSLCKNPPVLGPPARVAVFPRAAWRGLPLHQVLYDVVASAVEPGKLAAALDAVGVRCVSDRCRAPLPWDVLLSLAEFRASPPYT